MKKILTGIVAVGLLASCQQVQGWFGSDSKTDSTASMSSESVNKAKLLRDESITQENAYSDLFLDTAALENYIRTTKMDAGKADRMREFYIVRNNQFAWFTSEGVTEQARGLWGLYGSEEKKNKAEPAARIANRMDSIITNDSVYLTATNPGPKANKKASSSLKNQDTASIAKKNAYSLKGKNAAPGGQDTAAIAKRDSMATAARDSVALEANRKNFYSSSDSTLVNTELALTAQYVYMATENNSVITADNFYWLVPRKKMDAMTLADSLLNRQKDSSIWQGNQQYTTLKNSLQHYYQAAKNGGWPSIGSAAGLRRGAKSPAAVQLKKRLAASGDYAAGDTSNSYTDSLAMAIMTVQQQFGFTPTGMINDSLVQELNVPAEQRVQQILVNMNRAMWMPPLRDSSHIFVNIPSLELVVYGDSGRNLTMPVIVGKEGSGTMAFVDRITTVVFSPYWNLPQSIVENEIKPAMKKDPGYLKKRNMEIVKQEGDYLQIRQLPGKDNSLGHVKFLFPNSFDIYLHDTPNKTLFAQQNRALSHGCIRVAKPD
ncbi:MAG TPA: L,D-transpeptidase family protein, partial [Flavisolibacter sp.]|nr:L,D-transpeptidase family protein [Flavisolibacter sp.]